MNKLAKGTKSSIRVINCQVCNSNDLEEIISLGYHPQVNVMQLIGEPLKKEQFFPLELLRCPKCSLCQISQTVDPEIIFPQEYVYTSRTTKILREGFKELSQEAEALLEMKHKDLVVDIGSNDGTLLSNFTTKYKVLGVEPTDACHYANINGINTIQAFFTQELANKIVKDYGYAKLCTAANVFAHIEDIHSIVEGIKTLIGKDGVFCSENHYLVGLLENQQFDTLYFEHQRYLSLTSIKYLLEMHGLEIFHAKLIPTHGGSIRVYAANKGQFEIKSSVAKILENETKILIPDTFKNFAKNVIQSKIEFYKLLGRLSGTIGAIGAPSRAMTLIKYFALDENNLEFILEAPGSQKINKYAPGTKIPVFEETINLINSVDNLLLLSWHIAEEIIPKLRAKGFKGKFIVPLPYPHIIE